jgi:hypothetical protein
MEQHCRERRIALRKIMIERHSAQRERRQRAECIVSTPILKNLVLKSFDQATLRDIFGLTPDGINICEIQGEGGANQAHRRTL